MRVVKPLTAGKIEATKFNGSMVKLYDGGGLLLIVGKHTKTWHFSYKKPFTKKETTFKIGEYPYLSLTDARRLREEFKTDLALDIDPQEKRKAKAAELVAKEDNTFGNIYQKWKEVKMHKVKVVTMRSYESMYVARVKQHFENMPIEDITIPLVLEKLQVMEAEQQSKHIVRVMNFMQQVAAFATIIGVMKYNPLSDLGKIPLHYADTEHRLTIPPKELPDLMIALFEGQSLIMAKFAFMWQLLTMVRPGEAIAAEWEEINLEKREWAIPAEKMKGKRSKGRGHIVPLSDQAVRLLQEVHRFSGRTAFVFPSVRYKREDAQPLTKATTLRVIYEIGYKDKLTAHGLRSIASTYLNDEGESGDVIEACLAHTVGNPVRNAYNRSTFLDLRRPVMQKWADYVTSCIEGDFIQRLYKGNL